MKLCAIGILLIASAGYSQNPATGVTTTGRHYAKRILDVPGIDNVAEITPKIYRGGQPDEKGYRYLKQNGFKTVVSLREHHEEGAAVVAEGMNWVHIPLHADVTGSAPPTGQDIKRFFAVILDPKNQPVYFHCALGEDRTGTMAAIYRVEVDGWSSGEALQEMKAFGAHGIYKSLTNFVKSYKPKGIAKVVKSGTETRVESKKR